MLPLAHASREGFATRNTLFYLCRAELSTGTGFIFVAGCQRRRQLARGQTPVFQLGV